MKAVIRHVPKSPPGGGVTRPPPDLANLNGWTNETPGQMQQYPEWESKYSHSDPLDQSWLSTWSGEAVADQSWKYLEWEESG